MATPSRPTRSTLRQALVTFYETHAPEKLDNIDRIVEKYANAIPTLVRKLEERYGATLCVEAADSAAVSTPVQLAEYDEPAKARRGSCSRMSLAEYEREGRKYTERALKELVAQLKNESSKATGRRLLRSRKRSLVSRAKGLLTSLFYSREKNQEREAKEVDEYVGELAEKIIATHYYFHGKNQTPSRAAERDPAVAALQVALQQPTTPHVSRATPRSNVAAAAAAAARSTPTGRRPRPSFLDDIESAGKGVKRRSTRPSFLDDIESAGKGAKKRPARLSFLDDIKSGGNGLKKRTQARKTPGPKRTPLKPRNFLEEIALASKKKRKSTGQDRSPGLTPIRPKGRRAAAGPDACLRTALENALAARFKHVNGSAAASPARSDISDFSPFR